MKEARLMAITETGQSVTPPLGRVARKRNQKVREILIATAEVLNRDGYHAMSMEDVAEKIDITKATLYHYFNSKDDLVAACLSLVANEVNGRLRALAKQNEDLTATEQLRSLLVEQLTILLVDYREAARLFSQPLDWPPEHRKLIRSLRVPHDAIFRAAVESGVESGEFKTADPNVALHCIYGAINYAPLWVRVSSRSAVNRVIDSICETLLKTIS
jgi:AcrR family transcriptional regulator